MLLPVAIAGGLLAAPALTRPADVLVDQVTAERNALAEAQRQAAEAEARAARMSAQAEQAKSEAERERLALAALGLRIQSAEADLAAVRSQVAILATLERRQSARLAAQQRPVAELVASLQLLTRRPPVTVFAQPGAARDLVHMRALIDTMLPEIRRRTAGLRNEIARSRQLKVARQRAAESLASVQARLAERRTALARSEAQQRIRATTLASSAGLESDRALALGDEARDIGDLLGQLEDAGDVRDRLVRLQGPVPRPGTVRNGGTTGGAVPAVAGNPAYRLPVLGTVASGLGEVSAEGTRSRGLTIRTAPGAQVVAPAAGRIAYAGEFRSYGRIIIIDHGGGWTSLITNMIALSGQVGERVEQGAPIGRAGVNRPTITVELRRSGQPVDIATLVS
ncbi:peptidoglycan DD-metalloendopeptidase family protein [Sphingomonas lacunae]|uniref:Peptidoglycan DD-metalloendopeptidase family protein n=2 Tax=Sphingomonas lacunae TaxID=2698828 RepID=A0A6M4AXX9_9SPHN|nr:peptidoglycan DD-metalloendopeptidase family protein [Sphingomonas lacunae]